MSEIGEKWDLYLIGDIPMRWFDDWRAPKIIKLLLVFPYSAACLPWMLFWAVLDSLRDLWRDL